MILDRLAQLLNAKFPIEATLLGIVILVSPDAENALLSIDITLLGIVMLVSDVHNAKVSSAIAVILLH